MNDWSNEETDEPLLVGHRNFYKVEKWTKDGQRVERMLWAGNSIDKARETFRAAIKRRPGRYSIRQRSRMLEEWPTSVESLHTTVVPISRSEELAQTHNLIRDVGHDDPFQAGL